MIDYAKISVEAGDGGDGAVSFRILKGRPYGPPDGGDGGKGGDVYIVASRDKNTLIDFNYKKVFRAENGGRAGKNNRTGYSGEDTYIKVPVGTLVKDCSNKEEYDLSVEGKLIQIAIGGLGGKGNYHFKSIRIDKKSDEYWEAVHTAQKGFEGEVKEIILELKLLADIGIVGLPNSGKSTLLSVLTEAKPKIADYPFSTLEPYLGVMTLPGKSLVLADIPGLIEGASQGKGLGTQFLKHIERTKLLIHLVSAEDEDKISSFKVICNELQYFSKELTNKPMIVVLSKIDILDKNKIDWIKKEFRKTRVNIIPISAVTGGGLENLKKEILKRFEKRTDY